MSLRVALLSYRGKEHCGGQGVYIRHLSRELAALGHYVEVIAGPPYPVVDPGVRLTKLPGLDLYAEPNPFRTPRLSELRRIPDWVEFAGMRLGRFSEPLAFSLRVRRHLAARRGEFDVVHDNQSLGYGLLGIRGVPVMATIHHPVSIDSEMTSGSQRWYRFTRMQRRVAQRLPLVLTVSSASRAEIISRMDVRPARIRVTPLSADRIFRPGKPVPGRIVCVASADEPLKGLDYLLAAFAEARRQRDCELLVIGRPKPARQSDATFVANLPAAEYAELIASAEIVCVPSLFEGFSLPAVEAMACGVPVVATTGGALPEVVGNGGMLVPPGDSAALARALTDLLADSAARARAGQAGIARASQLSWRRTAEETVACYHELLGSVRPC
ncbi:glycosyltransferase involved in cell wall biosynthesis [Kibdelosporangium banguiense]|uniref:Glycosyltransferase involved in cell wall biosynthesis n=1 Tax=Kibdelosporangium banguiense TaxID=1365924 RepID=A0ABS4TJE4_9PSEU|nr:glycosyltransferase family 4 protein [Kibdelosporangium banguiense]MBP2324538.1 glycosyltransferase involved in cell wall biosynthesis [Kibdelosporangium banguiense]